VAPNGLDDLVFLGRDGELFGKRQAGNGPDPLPAPGNGTLQAFGKLSKGLVGFFLTDALFSPLSNPVKLPANGIAVGAEGIADA
jgi:hypothetical protein